MPVLTVIAEPNGSGKSTLTASLARQGVEFGEYLNADDIAAQLSGPLEWISRKAQQVVRDQRDAIRAADECVIYDNSYSDDPLRTLAMITRHGQERRLDHLASDAATIAKIRPDDMPAWWFEILLQIKPSDPYATGILS